MKIQYASDLHLEFPENREFLKANPLQPMGDILLLAGDIVPFAIMDEHKDFFNFVSDHFKITYWIPGNHEHYYSDIAEKSGTLNEKIKSNVFLINNTSVVYDNVKFIFSTLWSEISTKNQWIIQQNISDFQVIRFKGERFTTNHYNQLYQDSFNFLQRELFHHSTTGKQPLDHFHHKTLVVTHHVPTFYNYPQKYQEDALNEAFAVEHFDFIKDSDIDYWIFGHHHQNVSDFMVGKTRMLTNQLGYVNYNEFLDFDTKKIITI